MTNWCKGTLPARCGMRADGKIEHGFCGKPFQARGCHIGGSLLVAKICDICAIKCDIVRTNLPGRRKMFGDELAAVLHTSSEEAIKAAWDQFRDTAWVNGSIDPFRDKEPKENARKRRSVTVD